MDNQPTAPGAQDASKPASSEVSGVSDLLRTPIAALPPIGTEPVEVFVERLMKHASFDGVLEWVTCTLPGYDKVRVAFNVDNSFAITNLFLTRPPGVPILDIYRLWSLFIRKIENLPGGGDSPDPTQPQSYEGLVQQYHSLIDWIRLDGYEQAKVQRWGN